MDYLGAESEMDDLNSFIEERADFLEENDIANKTVVGSFYKNIHDALISRGTKLIVGPRGCGKTQLMRYVWLECKKDEEKPLAIYVSFNKYFRLEPLLKSKPDAIALFHTWALAKILLAAYEVAQSIEDDLTLDLSSILIAQKQDLETLVSRLEQSLSPPSELEVLAEKISVSAVTSSLHQLADWLDRKRIIVLLDDAAITLTPEYLYELFDVIRTLKTTRISLKASIYPGTTEFGPKFHVKHEAEIIDAWLSIEVKEYSEILDQIIKKRFREIASIPTEIVELFKYASFGIPRTLLVMLREYLQYGARSHQQRFNKIIEQHTEFRFAEYRSLINKLPRLESIISVGETTLIKIVEQIKQANQSLVDSEEKQIIIAIEREENIFFNRMISLLVEVGLLLKLPTVSHGDDRSYERYIPHLALLINSRAFSQGSRGFSAQNEVNYIKRKNTKHPVRRTIKSLLGDESISRLHLTLPPCRKCSAVRLSDNQRFCHNCGSPLVDESSFSKCMALELYNLPKLTSWQSQRVTELEGIKTVGDILSTQDPGTELRKLNRVGQKTAHRILNNVFLYVDEFLS
jgi:hypothetical protein